MDEWRLYPPLIDHWEEQGFRVASQVTDPRGTRWEIDIAAFNPTLTDVRLTEAKQTPSPSFANQCLDRLRFAPRVYAAIPAQHEEAMLATLDDANASMIGLLLIDEDARLAREAQPTNKHRDEGPARVLEQVLQATLA